MSVSYRRLATALVAAVLAVTASVAYGQRIWVGGGRFYRRSTVYAWRSLVRRWLVILGLVGLGWSLLYGPLVAVVDSVLAWAIS